MAKAAGRRSSRFPVTDGAASCGGAEETAPSSGSCLWGLSRNDPPHSASCPEAAWTARSVTGQILFLRPRPDDVLAARELADARGRHLPIDLSLPLPRAVSADSGEGGRESTVRCWSHRHTTSVAQEGRTTTGSTWTGDGKRRQAGQLVGWRRLSTSIPGRSGAVSHRTGHHICPHSVTGEPYSSWTASTSRHWAFQEEVARSDLGGRRPKGGNPLGSRQEGKRGTPICIKLRKEEVKRSKGKLASSERILQKKDHVRSLTERSR